MGDPAFEIVQLGRALLRLWDENKVRPSLGRDVALANHAFEELRAELARYDATNTKTEDKPK